MKQLVIIRGNSGSGKTTTAKAVQAAFAERAMLLSQDVLRRDILKAKEDSSHPTKELLKEMTLFGWEHGYDIVIVEGIWSAKKNRAALIKLITLADSAHVYYFDIPFEETLRRHALKPNATDFGEAEMRSWWKEYDVLGVQGEYVFDSVINQRDVIKLILSRLE